MRKMLVVSMLLPLTLAVNPVSAEPSAHHVVQAGAVNPENPSAPYVYTDFYPRTLEVHRHRTVKWEFPNVGSDLNRAFHSVAFLPDGHPSYFRPDDLPDSAAFDEGVAFPSAPCGGPTQSRCIVDDTDDRVSSGVPIGRQNEDGSIMPFYVQISLPERAEPYRYHCTIHRQMHGYIKVVPQGVALSNPTAAQIAAQIQADTDAADALREARSVPSFEDVDGRREWKVTVGDMTSPHPAVPGGLVQDGGVLILAFMPSTLTISPEDSVRYEVQDELHTVTFPDPVDQVDPGFAPACDPDARETGLPGVPGFICPPGWNFEVVLTPFAYEMRAPDDVVRTGSLHHSGLMTPADAPDWVRARPAGSGMVSPSTFDASFPDAGSFAYRCQIHIPFMTGSVTVA